MKLCKNILLNIILFRLSSLCEAYANYWNNCIQFHVFPLPLKNSKKEDDKHKIFNLGRSVRNKWVVLIYKDISFILYC